MIIMPLVIYCLRWMIDEPYMLPEREHLLVAMDRRMREDERLRGEEEGKRGDEVVVVEGMGSYGAVHSIEYGARAEAVAGSGKE
jgi:hypothetical protein